MGLNDNQNICSHSKFTDEKAFWASKNFIYYNKQPWLQNFPNSSFSTSQFSTYLVEYKLFRSTLHTQATLSRIPVVSSQKYWN